MSKLALVMVLGGGLVLAGPVWAADAAAGKTKAAAACVDCHGDNGKGDEDNPAIAGMASAEFTKAMKEYQAGTRKKSKKMIKAAQKVSDEDMADMAAYYESLPK